MDDDFNFPVHTGKTAAPTVKKSENLLLNNDYDSVAPEISPEDVEDILPHKLSRKVFINELENCDVYLENIHSSFKYATSISGVIALVNTGMAVNNHRRKVLQEASGLKPAATIEYDVMGREKS